MIITIMKLKVSPLLVVTTLLMGSHVFASTNEPMQKKDYEKALNIEERNNSAQRSLNGKAKGDSCQLLRIRKKEFGKYEILKNKKKLAQVIRYCYHNDETVTQLVDLENDQVLEKSIHKGSQTQTPSRREEDRIKTVVKSDVAFMQALRSEYKATYGYLPNSIDDTEFTPWLYSRSNSDLLTRKEAQKEEIQKCGINRCFLIIPRLKKPPYNGVSMDTFAIINLSTEKVYLGNEKKLSKNSHAHSH